MSRKFSIKQKRCLPLGNNLNRMLFNNAYGEPARSDPKWAGEANNFLKANLGLVFVTLRDCSMVHELRITTTVGKKR